VKIDVDGEAGTLDGVYKSETIKEKSVNKISYITSALFYSNYFHLSFLKLAVQQSLERSVGFASSRKARNILKRKKNY
jgi:hypothetical protein